MLLGEREATFRVRKRDGRLAPQRVQDGCVVAGIGKRMGMSNGFRALDGGGNPAGGVIDRTKKP